MLKISACIFDLDGVIVDTAVYHYQAWKRLANELGFDFTLEQNECLKGISRMQSLDLILAWGGLGKSLDEKRLLADKKNEWYVDMITKIGPDDALPGALDFLAQLKKAGFKTALGSASKNSALILERTKLTTLFDVIVDGNSVTASKPDPEVFMKGAEALATSPAACVVFEDAIAGIEAAKAAGMKVIGIGNKEILTNADLVVSGLDKMSLDLLERV